MSKGAMNKHEGAQMMRPDDVVTSDHYSPPISRDGSPVDIRGVHKSYSQGPANKQENNVKALDGFSITIPHGQFVAFCGPNGCGKSTLLAAVSGSIEIDQGEILIAGKTVHEARKAVVFQNYRDSLFPWRSVIDNITMPLELAGMSKHHRRDCLAQLASESGINVPQGRFPYQLSGGNQQRVCLLRSFIVDADILLMDEPFSALDQQTHQEMQLTLQDLWLQRRTTTLYVSHEIRESIFLADRLILLSKRPASIVTDISISLPRPRTLALFEDPASPIWNLEAEATRIFNRETGGRK